MEDILGMQTQIRIDDLHCLPTDECLIISENDMKLGLHRGSFLVTSIQFSNEVSFYIFFEQTMLFWSLMLQEKYQRLWNEKVAGQEFGEIGWEDDAVLLQAIEVVIHLLLVVMEQA